MQTMETKTSKDYLNSGGWDLNPRPLGYEPSELPTALPRDNIVEPSSPHAMFKVVFSFRHEQVFTTNSQSC